MTLTCQETLWPLVALPGAGTHGPVEGLFERTFAEEGRLALFPLTFAALEITCHTEFKE